MEVAVTRKRQMVSVTVRNPRDGNEPVKEVTIAKNVTPTPM